MADRNRAAGEAWRLLGNEEKQKYFDICETNAASLRNPATDGTHDVQHELKRILQNLQQNVSISFSCNIIMIFV